MVGGFLDMIMADTIKTLLGPNMFSEPMIVFADRDFYVLLQD